MILTEMRTRSLIWFYISFAFGLILLFSNSCKKKEDNPFPILTTTEVSDITLTTATSGGSITYDGGSTVIARGVCWSTLTNPTIELNSKTSDGILTGNFNSNLTDLTENTKYYVRVYAVNHAGTGYGNTITFTTQSAQLPTLTTSVVSYLSQTSASCGGIITTDGGSIVTTRGVCWSTSSNPTIALSTKTIDGTEIGVFTSVISGLTASTTYYIRAYATNRVGTSYGNEISFISRMNLPGPIVNDVDGNSYNSIYIGKQLWLKGNLRTTKYRDGSAITNITDVNEWISQTNGAFCWYNNDIANKTTYGGLYNYYSVVDNRNICPLGWHIPSDEEWITLENYLGAGDVAGGKLKSTALWNSPNTGANNISGFTALPSGYRGYGTGSFMTLSEYGHWWSKTELNVDFAYFRQMIYNTSSINKGNYGKRGGFSVRCISD